MITVYFDGLCQPINPGGIACYAYLIKKNGMTVHSEYGLAAKPYSRDATNNVAEYTGLIKALEWLSSNKLDQPIRIISDSALVVRQLRGEYKVKSRRIVPLYRRAALLKDSFKDVKISWVPREQNSEADALTNVAYQEALESTRYQRKTG